MSDPQPAPSPAENARADNTAAALAIGALLLYGAIIGVLLFQPIPAENREIVAGAVGLIGGTLVGGAFGFYFGSSKSSSAKDATIATMAAGR